jgi:hypothetical protein
MLKNKEILSLHNELWPLGLLKNVCEKSLNKFAKLELQEENRNII